MSRESRSVHEAIDRWEERGIVDSETAYRLREDVDVAARAGTARLGQYVVASTAAIVLVIAAGVFVDWTWPRMGEGARSAFLAAVGVGVSLWGARLESMRRWVPAALLMQTAGLALLLWAFVYAENAWSGGPASVVTGVLALAVPIVFAPRAFRRSVVMPAVHLCFSLGFLAVFLDRTTHLDPDGIIWVLDAVLLLAGLGLMATLRSDADGERHPWALNAFVAAVYAGLGLVFMTAAGPLDLNDGAVYPLDAWLLLVFALTLWGIHRAPAGLRREWFGSQLAYAMGMWIPLGIFTVSEAMDGPPELVVVLVGGAGAAGFAYAVRTGIRRMLVMSALTFVVAICYWAVDRAGALGGILALAATSALLFRLSGRVQRWMGGGPSRARTSAGSASDEGLP